ncbi:MAG: GAF domain-containing protein [Deltaproteobacteria bacterium]|nr:GAF domain-containing protein [Deltaproteobacteria bacterium]
MIRRLERAGHRVNLAREPAEANQCVVDLTAEAFRMDIVGLYLKDPVAVGRLGLAARYDYPVVTARETADLGEGIIGWVAENRKPALVPDVRADPRYVEGIAESRSEMAVPLLVGDEVLGVLDVQSRALSAFGDTELALLEAFAVHVACALQATREREISRRKAARLGQRAERFELIHRVGQTLVEDVRLDEAMQRVVEMVATALDYNLAAVLLLDREIDELYFVSQYGYEAVHGLRIPLSQGATGYAVRHAEPVNIPDVATDSRYIKGTGQGRSELAVPISLRDEVIGVIDVESPVPAAFGDEDVNLLSAVASYAAAAIGASRLRAEAERRLMKLDDRTRRLDLLNRVSRSLTRKMALDELLDRILGICSEAFDLRHCAVLLLDPADGVTLVRRAAIGYDTAAPVRLALGEGITGHVARTGVPIYVPDVTKDPRYVAGASGGRAEMAAPLKVFDEVIGVLDAESTVVEGFDEEDLDLFTSFAAQAAVAIRSAELTTELRDDKEG